MNSKNINNILLIRNVCSTISEPELPLNLLILAACLEKAGYSPLILDYDKLKFEHPEILGINDDSVQFVANDILSHDPDCVLFTCMCSNFARSISIIKRIRYHAPNLFIGIGGPHVSMCAVDTMKAYNEFLNCVIVGEGEETIVDLINCLNENADLKLIKGLCLFSDKVILTEKRNLLLDLDYSPIPAYHLINVDDYNTITGKTNVYIGSGCPFSCSFCTTSLMWERHYRTKSVARIIKELTLLKDKYNKSNFVFIHDNLTANKDFALSLVNSIKESHLNIQYEISSRIDTIDEEFIRLFKESGGKTIFFGIESGSERMQKTIGKNLKLDRIYEILESCKNNGVEASTSFIIGFPDESLEDLESTIKLAFRCRIMLEDQVGMNLLSIYPGSPLSKTAYNYLYLDEINYEFPMYQRLSDEEIDDIKKFKSIYINYYLYEHYSNGLNAVDIHKLFDYVTITLEKYQYTFNYLLNILDYSFINIFETQVYTIENLSAEDKDRYIYEINGDRFVEDLNGIIKDDERFEVLELLQYDSCINTFYTLSLEHHNFLYYKVFKFFIDLENSCFVKDSKYYMVIAKNGNLFDVEISNSIYNDINELNCSEDVEKYLSKEFDISIENTL